MPKSSSIRVVLVCSGSNEWDDAGRLSGSADLPLSDVGLGSADELVASMACGPIAEVWTGPEEAASGTAGLIAGDCGVRTRVQQQLHEVGLGLWEGMLWAHAEERFASVFKQWRDDSSAVVPPGGESSASAEARLCNALRDILLRTKADASTGVCIVLRPIAFGIAEAWLGESETGVPQRPQACRARALTFVIDRASLKRGARGVGNPIRDAG